MSKYNAIAHQAARELLKKPKNEVDKAIRQFKAGKPELGKLVEKVYHELRSKKLNTINKGK